jgi:hypothetical protein
MIIWTYSSFIQRGLIEGTAFHFIYFNAVLVKDMSASSFQQRWLSYSTWPQLYKAYPTNLLSLLIFQGLYKVEYDPFCPSKVESDTSVEAQLTKRSVVSPYYSAADICGCLVNGPIVRRAKQPEYDNHF